MKLIRAFILASPFILLLIATVLAWPQDKPQTYLDKAREAFNMLEGMEWRIKLIQHLQEYDLKKKYGVAEIEKEILKSGIARTGWKWVKEEEK